MNKLNKTQTFTFAKNTIDLIVYHRKVVVVEIIQKDLTYSEENVNHP